MRRGMKLPVAATIWRLLSRLSFVPKTTCDLVHNKNDISLPFITYLKDNLFGMWKATGRNYLNDYPLEAA